jgi:hypothetical protein
MALFASITWTDGSSSNWPSGQLYLRCQVDTFFTDFLASTTYFDALGRYLAVPHFYVFPGPYAGTTGMSVLATGTPKGIVSDDAIQVALQSDIQGGATPYSTAPIFYCILVPFGVVVIDRNGVRSDDPKLGFGGYHGLFPSTVGPINYCVVLDTGDINDLTYRLSHETVEQMTNSDGSGWYGTPDPFVSLALGLPANTRLEICDYTALPFQEIVKVHGWEVAPFAYEVVRTYNPDGYTQKNAPADDSVAASQPDHGRILLDTKLTRTSCFGDIIEYQEAYFRVSATHYGQDQIISTWDWSFQCDPPGIASEVRGHASPLYALQIPIGCTSVTVRCTMYTSFLRCLVSVEQRFNVVTQKQADSDDAVCAFLKRVKGEQYFDPHWWVKSFDPEFNPKAREVDEAITRLAIQEGVDRETVAKAKPLALRDLAARISAMITAFRTGG